MVWDRNEIVILGGSMLCISGLAAIKVISGDFVQAQFALIIGYAVGRIFNHAQGKE